MDQPSPPRCARSQRPFPPRFARRPSSALSGTFSRAREKDQDRKDALQKIGEFRPNHG